MEKVVFQVLIGILIIVVAILACVYFYQRRAVKQINDLMESEKKLADQKVDQQIKNVEELQLIGDAKKQFETIKNKYEKQVRPAITAFNKRAPQLLADSRTSKLLTINTQIRDLQADLAKLTTTLQQIQKDLQHLRQQQHTHKQAVEQIKNKYRQFHRQLNEKSFEYGDSEKQLNSRLNELEDQFAQFTDLTNKGDIEAAQEILSNLQSENDKFEQDLKKIPQLYKPIATEFPEQLSELKGGYETLVKQNFHFTEKNIDKQIEQLQAKLDQTIDQLNNLQLDVVEQSNKDLSDQIDYLYGVMQKEIDAKNEAIHLIEVMKDFTKHAQRQNDELGVELDRLSLNYTLTNHEQETVRELGEQIKAIIKQYRDDAEAVANKTAVYSQVLDRQKSNQKNLTEIEKSQEKLNDEVAKLQTDEQRARQMLQKYSTQIRTIHRQVEQLNLPGLPKDYLDYFFGVSDEIKKLADELNEYKINMDEITKQLIIVESDLDTLNDKTDILRDSAELTERFQQYANRFSDNEKIAAAAKKSQELFKQFNYTASLEAIATVLEEIEPGSYKRIEDTYYREIGKN
ncbi:septation ring formation regulator EzrA [Limosilactobacillus reuteri]|uniref:Septation ring formation regulator EzrA n=1 Tax=Limosilactobacillus reuteri TaxID=1598 RepID=A0A256VIR5_LIMRT|nr:septation ring formation regulator EzrA [Limosilactobacillus reuteri]OYS62005.1 septation ring formation regulator EzrA [Limosilactobacillus reuteri]OYS63739.1 septation ring formation regulator EzrA [Limosilactobacillus reuteri]OYS71774.1 septation ring formation regulator EzrA [Limosilactobacillus reuteri]OYS73725.1 septation ring formation regulator EzrA [Limosilactobacillus reuteri]